MAVQCRHLAHLCEVVVVPSDGNEILHQRVNIAGRGTNKAELGPASCGCYRYTPRNRRILHTIWARPDSPVQLRIQTGREPPNTAAFRFTSSRRSCGLLERLAATTSSLEIGATATWADRDRAATLYSGAIQPQRHPTRGSHDGPDPNQFG